jgi:alpha-N-arabinofuranosidase
MNEATIRFDSTRVLHRISPYLHGQLIENVGRCIYGGLWVGRDPEIATVDGLRGDVLEALRTLCVPVVRWRGGCPACEYRWRDGVGPVEKRPATPGPFPFRSEPNAFGTDEFLSLCRHLDADPYISAGVTANSTAEPAQWLAYCRSRQPARAAPFKTAPFWGIGTHEPDPQKPDCEGGPQTADHERATQRPDREGGLMGQAVASDGEIAPAVQAARSLRATQPDVRIILRGGADLSRAERLLDSLPPNEAVFDHLAVERHCGRRLTDRDGSPEKLLGLWREGVDLGHFLRNALQLVALKDDAPQPMGLVLDRWGTFYREANVENQFLMAGTLADALFAADALHLFHSLGERFVMATLARAVNSHQSLLHVEGRHVAKSATYQAFLLLQPHQGGRRIRFEAQSPSLDLGGGRKIEQLSAGLTRDERGRVYLTLVNRSPHEPLLVRILDEAGQAVRLERGRALHAQSLASENFPGRPNQVALRPLPGELRAPIQVFQSTAVGAYVGS